MKLIRNLRKMVLELFLKNTQTLVNQVLTHNDFHCCSRMLLLAHHHHLQRYNVALLPHGPFSM